MVSCPGDAMEDKRKDCEQEFIRIWNRLSTGDSKFDGLVQTDHAQDLQIKELQTNMVNLVKSISNLTKAIWGMVLSIAGIGIGFIVWYIQNH